MRSQFTFTFVSGFLPCVEVTSQERDKRLYGFTPLHALERAHRWAAKHGDTRFTR